ncbi:FeoB-associated Cys-rich membrane protein [Thaumasiovibrio subtropicus]|uniref:FeoB-associated Cys-rich membrane protein n=1 Tax=Thaumasiovibrio subtropicus TaxID=1891207 RepID=UPI000B34D525|nr:FeoB-associated Cys-rich membrane protein [Thaumasiovibrio subtropicus]
MYEAQQHWSEFVIVAAIIAAALGYLYWKLVKKRGQCGSCGNCKGNSDCHSKKTQEPHPSTEQSIDVIEFDPNKKAQP